MTLDPVAPVRALGDATRGRNVPMPILGAAQRTSAIKNYLS